MSLPPRHAGYNVDIENRTGTVADADAESNAQPPVPIAVSMERVHKMRWSSRGEREDAAKHLHRKLLEVERIYQQCHQALKEVQQEEEEDSLGIPTPARTQSNNPLPPKAKLPLLLMNGINELKKDEYDGIFGWHGAANGAEGVIASDHTLILHAMEECKALEMRIMAYEQAILREHIDDVHQLRNSSSSSSLGSSSPTRTRDMDI